MKINYCLPIQKNTAEEVLEIIEKNIKKYEYFEIWLDYISNLDQEFIIYLKNYFENRLIFLFRRLENEKIKMPMHKRLEIINFLSNSSIILDLDITQKEELDYLRSGNFKIKTIISYHNYQKTPPSDKLNEVVNAILAYNPTILKISTMCKNKNDALRLLNQQLKLRGKGIKCIILGMGELGKITRIFGAIWGNELVFAPISESKLSNFKGQLTKTQLESIFDILQK